MRINVETAIELIQNYKNNHLQAINDNCISLQDENGLTIKEDSRSVWFSLSDLISLINDVQSKGGNGIRFYFGEYSQNIIDNALPVIQAVDPAAAANMAQYKGMATLVLVPTKLDVNFNNADFNVVSGTYDFGVRHRGDLVAMNHGGMIPPPWPEVMNAPTTYQESCGASLLDL